ncbi:MAG: hypothetical protein JNL38_41770, partial [Myxococcales bacterium]|nr:hypothetical protein [Myxococcales bacterium]
FRSVSGGRLALSPAAESSGTPNDGVVVASVGTYASYATPPDASDELGRQRARARAMVQAADAAVDFRAFDRNGDGRVTTDELAVIGLHAEDVANAAYTRDMDRELVLDGKRVQLRVALAPIGVGLGTIIHEAAHVVLNQRDMYGWGVGWHALGGGMVDRSTQLYHPSGWEKIHLGWARPVVVSHDGYYDVPRLDGPDPAAYILYDPAKGTQHYFVVENRVRSPGTYEQDVADTGLFVSRVDERRFLDNELRAVEPMWPRGQLNAKREWGAPPGESYAWDPLDPTTPQRELSAPWGDQTPSNVAIRAVGARGDVVRAYFDVPGPGALVDCFDSAGPSGDKRVGLLAGRATTARLPIMNTGDAPDELEVRVEGAPAGVTIAPVRRRLGAKERALVDLVVTAPSTLPSTTTRAWAVVESTANRAVGSRCPVSLVGPSAYGYAWYAHGGPQTAAYDLSSSGGAVTKTRRDVGHYEVSFAGLTGAGGVAHVRAYGSTEAHCSLDSWWSAGDALKVAVRCWDSADRPRDASFLLGYAR